MVIYAVFTVSSLVTPQFINYIGETYALALAALGYGTFIISNIWTNSVMMIISSCIVGLSSGLLWNAQGNYLGACAILYNLQSSKTIEASTSYLNGLFYLFVKLSDAIGNISFSFLLKWIPSTSTLFTITSVLTLIGAIVFFFLPKIEKPEEEKQVKITFVDTWNLLVKTTPIKFLIIACFHVGISYINIYILEMVFVLLILINLLLKKH